MSARPATLTPTVPFTPAPASNHAVCPCCGGPVEPDELLIDFGRGTVSFGGGVARLTPGQARLLSILRDAWPAVVPKEAAYDRLYAKKHVDRLPEPKVIDVIIWALRARIEPLGLVIRTHWGQGYALDRADGQANQRILAAAEAARQIRRAGTAHDERIRELAARGTPFQEIARRCSLSYRTVAAILARLKAEPTETSDGGA